MDSAEVLAALAAALPSEVLISDRDVTQSLSHDEAEWAPVGEALALIRATTSDQVATTVRICASFGVPVTARGAGTGLSGGANAIDGGVIIALDRLNQIRLIDPLERLAVVQAGVINDELRAAAARAVVSAGSGKLALVNHWRQHRDQCWRGVLRQVRRD
jgi:glycolate oxidase